MSPTSGPIVVPYEAERDLAAVQRIWREVGWVEGDSDEEALAGFLDASNVEVALIDGTAECAVAWLPGSIRYQHTDLPLAAITAVTTSLVARKHRLATTMTARAVRAGAEAGAAVAALGMFDQGFYDRLGFGTNTYDHEITLDPSTLAVEHVPYRHPVRLTAPDHVEMHALLARRARRHGGVVLSEPAVLHAELQWLKKPWGLGYRGDDGRLTHFIYGEADDSAHGPYRVRFLAYEEPRQLLDLLRLVRELADQISSVTMIEPPDIQIHDLLRTPLARNRQTKSSVHATGTRSVAWAQSRIIDLEATVAERRWPGPTVACNLALDDPITPVLDGLDSPGDDTMRWRGGSGTHVLRIGAPSTVEPGTDAALPTLSASIGAFTRCWFGVRPATDLALTDELDGPPALLGALDEALSLPPPRPGWDF